MESETGRARGGIQSVQRALRLLRAFSCERPELGVNELARRFSLHPSTISRLLATLADGGFVRVNPATRCYRLGFAVVELAGLVLSNLDCRDAARPVMRELARVGGETSNLAVLDGNEAVVIEQVASMRPCRYVSWVGRRVPLHATAHGKVLLAFEGVERRERLLDALADSKGLLPRLAEHTCRTRDALAAELGQVASQGFATAHGEMDPDLAAVAAPVFDHRGTVVASLSLSGPRLHYDAARTAALASLVVDGARRISADLGWLSK